MKTALFSNHSELPNNAYKLFTFNDQSEIWHAAHLLVLETLSSLASAALLELSKSNLYCMTIHTSKGPKKNSQQSSRPPAFPEQSTSRETPWDVGKINYCLKMICNTILQIERATCKIIKIIVGEKLNNLLLVNVSVPSTSSSTVHYPAPGMNASKWSTTQTKWKHQC